MTAYAKPVAQRPQNWLAQLRSLAATSAATTTEYTVELPQREAGDTRPESERGETVAIVGSLSHDHQGNATGLTGWGHAAKLVVSGTVTEKSRIVKGIDTVGLVVGAAVSGTKIKPGTTITKIEAAKEEIELSAAAEGSGSAEVKESLVFWKKA